MMLSSIDTSRGARQRHVGVYSDCAVSGFCAASDCQELHGFARRSRLIKGWMTQRGPVTILQPPGSLQWPVPFDSGHTSSRFESVRALPFAINPHLSCRRCCALRSDVHDEASVKAERDDCGISQTSIWRHAPRRHAACSVSRRPDRDLEEGPDHERSRMRDTTRRR
jgi:hypothetical protein